MNNKWTWLKEYMQKHNISQGDVAEALKWQKTRVSELLCGKRDFPVNKVFPAARFFNLDLEELTKYNSGFTKEIPSTDGKKPQKPQKELVKVEIVNPSGSEKEVSFQTIGQQLITDDIFKILTSSSPENLKAMIARGDSMQPTINDGDLIWVDLSVKIPVTDGLYLFALKGEVFIKRLQLDNFNHSAAIISDNPLYPPISINKPDKISTLGKIVSVTKAYR
jgi:phage repressor protein C with HTH and peptisase S24 domain